MDRRRITTAGAGLAGIAFAGLALTPLFVKGISPVTSGVILGALGTLCIVAIGLGICNVRRGEAKRRAKLQIWMKH
jgi:hypothetical protein